MATPGDTRTSGLARLLPITAWLPGYRASRLRGDGIGALTAWVFQRAWHLLTQLDQWSLTTMAVGLGCGWPGSPAAATAELQASGLADQLGPVHLHTTLDDAVAAFTAAERHTPPSST
jgi:hypothetical protein